jgi:thioredoxin-related protein
MPAVMSHVSLRSTATLTAALIAAAVAPPTVEAARDMDAPPADSSYEIVVMEVEGCRYCPLFRSDVLPVYLATPRAREVPVRFQDINAADMDRLKLKGAIDTVPTAVLMQDKAEIGRIPGYVAPESFARMITDMMLGRK